MICEKHPNNSGIIWLGNMEICYDCYCEQYEYCPLCGRKWDDPLECKMGDEDLEATSTIHDFGGDIEP